jgi:hypothetical protein
MQFEVLREFPKVIELDSFGFPSHIALAFGQSQLLTSRELLE